MVRQYIGARYVTKIYENSLDPSSAEWESGVTYEPLTMVTYLNSSYLSKREVPGNVGNPAANPTYWVVTGAYNGQILDLQNRVTALETLENTISKTYNTVTEMAADELEVGDIVRTIGYYAANDGGGAIYYISDTASGFYEEVGALYAIMVFDTIFNVKAAGLKGNYETNSAAVINKIVSFIENAAYTSNEFTSDLYYGNNVVLYFPKDKYKFSMETSAGWIDIIGNGSIVNGDGSYCFKFTGTKVNIDGFSFVNCTNGIYYVGANLEAGYFNVTNCRFYKTTGDAVRIDDLQSYIGTIEKCLFFQCKHTLNIEHYADHFTIKECWISVLPMDTNYDASILATDDNGELYVDNCIFVPTGYSTNNIYCAYIKCANNCTVTQSHFGGEVGSLPILITDVKTGHITRGHFTIRDCPNTYCQNNGRALVIIKSTFNDITIDNCIGFADVQKPVRFAPGYSPTDVNYGDIILNNLRGNTYPPFDSTHGMYYMWGYKYLQKELYPYLQCDSHITNKALNLTFSGLNIVGFNNLNTLINYYMRSGIIRTLVSYVVQDTSIPEYYHTVEKEIDIYCYKNGASLIYKTSDPDYVTVTNNATNVQETDITIAPTAKCSDLTILKVWSDPATNEDETLAYPDPY